MTDGIGGTDSAHISDATLDLIRRQAMQMHANGNVGVANGILLQLAILDELRAIRAHLQHPHDVRLSNSLNMLRIAKL